MCHYDIVPRAQPTYTPTAMNYDFALITLKAPVDGPGWLGLTAGSGNPTYALTTAGYPGEKPSGTMWMSTCSSVAINFAGNQGVFTDIDQCQSQARAPGGAGALNIWEMRLCICLGWGNPGTLVRPGAGPVSASVRYVDRDAVVLAWVGVARQRRGVTGSHPVL